MRELLVGLFDTNLETAALALFEHLSVEVTIEAKAERVSSDIACSVGFASPHLRGSLTMTAERNFVSESRPAELRITDANETEISDWMGELGNQLLGRLKNRLISHGVVIDLGTPAVLCGVDIRRHTGRRGIACERLIVGNGGRLVIHLDADVSEEFQFAEVAGAEAMPEGEVALF